MNENNPPGKATNWRENHRFGTKTGITKHSEIVSRHMYIYIYVHLEPEKKGRVVFTLFLFPVIFFGPAFWLSIFMYFGWVTQLHVLQFLAPKCVRKKTPKKTENPTKPKSHHTCGLFAAPSWRRLWFPCVAWRNFQRFRIRICLRVFVAEKHEPSTTYFQGTGGFSLVGENRLLLKSTLPTHPAL